MSVNDDQQPVEHASDASPISGVVPPPEYRWKPGQSGNPKGRPSAGLAIVEWLNQMQELPYDEIEAVAKDKKAPAAKRAAAIQWIDILTGSASLEDFEAYVNGKKTLKQLAESGVAVRRLKKAKVSTAKDGAEQREIELSDTPAHAIDRVLDRTQGKPAQAVQHTGKGGGGIRVIIEAADPDDVED